MMEFVGPAGALDTSGLLERAEHIGALAECLATVNERAQGRLVLLHGEAGIGKTALLGAFCGELGARVRVLWAACDPLFTPRPLGPLLDIARETEGELRTRVESGAKPHDVVSALIGELESPAPTVLVIEDLHWADEATLDVVRLLARRVQEVQALFVVSYRDEQVHRTHPLRVLLGELPGGGAVTRLGLSSLSPQAVAALAERSELDVDELYEKTAGNPFFVTETLAAGGERVPPTVRDAVLARAARLSPQARALLDAVAVVPQRVEVWLLEALTQGALDALDECLTSGMLRTEADGVAFRHELARLAIEESLVPDRMVALQRRALVALEQPSIGAPDLARLSHHAEAAGDSEAVLRFAPAAADEAAAVGSHREAQAQYARALRVAQPLDPDQRADLLERFADEGYYTDMREEAIDALDEVAAIHTASGDLVRQGDALRRRSRLLGCAGRAQEAWASAEEAASVLEQAPLGRELARAYAQLAGLSMRLDDVEQTLRWGGRAITLAEQVDDVEALVHALNAVGTMELTRGRAEGREKLERCVELGKKAGLTAEVGNAYINLLAALSRRREWPDDTIQAGTDYCRKHGLDAWLRYMLCAKAESDLAQGRWSEAAETAGELLSAPPDAVVGPRYMALVNLALVRARRGDPECWPLLDEAREMGQSVGELQYLAPVAAARAEALWLESRAAEIGPETDAAFELALEQQEPSSIGELACWRWRAGILVEPPAEIDELFRLQIAGDWEQAARLWSEKSYPYEAALALADSGSPDAMRQALDTFRELGARPAAAIVTRRLRELGERRLPRGPRPQTQENPHGLTARELEVLLLVAEGLRNAKIAERLIVSQKTVDHHVSAILRKLGVQTRGEAAAEATRLGLVTLPGEPTPARSPR